MCDTYCNVVPLNRSRNLKFLKEKCFTVELCVIFGKLLQKKTKVRSFTCTKAYPVT